MYYTYSKHGKFQSTPPARGATIDAKPSVSIVEFQSTPPARGATWTSTAQRLELQLFQSTPPARGATSRTAAEREIS